MPNCREGAQLTPESWIIQIAMLLSYLCFFLKWDNREGRGCVAQWLEQCTSTRGSDCLLYVVLTFHLPLHVNTQVKHVPYVFNIYTVYVCMYCIVVL